MITALKRTAFALLITFFALTASSQIIVTNNVNATQLAQRLVGDGIVISNATITGATGTGGIVATGFFKNNGGNLLNLDSGIVLTTGSAKSNPANFTFGVDGSEGDFASSGLGTGGNPQLEAYYASVPGGTTVTTNDAVILEFDFVPIGDTVRFRYVFGSEEYPGFTCSSFTDIFAFFISGPGITGSKNLALVPGTNIPIAINTINGDDTPGPLCTAFAGAPYVQYYIDNSIAPSTLTYGGHTVVLTAESVVVPCQTYHMRLIIADAGDQSYDSGVFLQARSLTSAPLQIVNNNPVTSTGIPYVIEGCTAGAIKIDRKRKFNFPQPVNITYVGTAQNSIDLQTMPTQVTIPAGDSIVTIPIFPIADNVTEGDETLKILVTFGSCGAATSFYADSISILVRDQLRATSTSLPSNCANNTGSLTISVPAGNGNSPYTYAVNGGTFQSSNILTGLASGTNLVTVRDSNGCVHNIVTTVGLNNNLTLSLAPADTSICRGATFTPRVTSAATQYTWSPSGGISNPSIAQPVITVGNSTQYILSAYQGACSTSAVINVTAIQPPAMSAGADITMVFGDVVQLTATAGPGSYLWSPAAGLSATNILNPTASPDKTTTYTLTATSPQGCVSTDDVTVTVLSCVEPMNAFTPNGDGINDRWLVNLRQCYTKAVVEVFNRYGNRVYHSTAYQNDWDGRYQGKDLPDGTYYYVITLDLINGKKTYVKGNVTILR